MSARAAVGRMRLADLPTRPPMAPWAEGNTIPWDDRAFSERMLREHPSQAHDAASRRLEKADRHVAWLAAAGLGPPRVVPSLVGEAAEADPHLQVLVARRAATVAEGDA